MCVLQYVTFACSPITIKGAVPDMKILSIMSKGSKDVIERQVLSFTIDSVPLSYLRHYLKTKTSNSGIAELRINRDCFAV